MLYSWIFMHNVGYNIWLELSFTYEHNFSGFIHWSPALFLYLLIIFVFTCQVLRHKIGLLYAKMSFATCIHRTTKSLSLALHALLDSRLLGSPLQFINISLRYSSPRLLISADMYLNWPTMCFFNGILPPYVELILISQITPTDESDGLFNWVYIEVDPILFC